MNGLINWWLRNFKVISQQHAEAMGLKHLRNIHGDEINAMNCRSIWTDSEGLQYRVRELYEPFEER